MAETDDRQIKCLYLPMTDGPGVVVPGTLVAEIITQQAVSEPPRESDWLLATGAWRGTEIPLISFERLSGLGTGDADPAGRYVVLFSLEPDRTPAYYGLAIQALPRSETVDADRLTSEARSADDPSVVAMRGRLGDRECIIPDLDVLTQRVRAEMDAD